MFAYGAATRDCAGNELADLGLLAEAARWRSPTAHVASPTRS